MRHIFTKTFLVTWIAVGALWAGTPRAQVVPASEYGRRRNRAAIRACKGKSDGVIPDHCERHDRSQFSGR